MGKWEQELLTYKNRRGSEPAVRCRKFDPFGSGEMRTFLVAAAVFVNGDRFISGSEGQKRSIGILKTEDVVQPLFESGGQEIPLDISSQGVLKGYLRFLFSNSVCTLEAVYLFSGMLSFLV